MKGVGNRCESRQYQAPKAYRAVKMPEMHFVCAAEPTGTAAMGGNGGAGRKGCGRMDTKEKIYI